jgi:hypothetical protein
LYKESYELECCTYSFWQGTDQSGKPQMDAKGGAIYITYPNIPPKEILQWALDDRKYYDGTIVICDDSGQPLEKIGFEQAALVKMKMEYSQEGTGFLSTNIELRAFSLQVGVHFLTNRWVGF